MKVERWRTSTKPTNSLRNYPRQVVHPTTRFYHTTLTRFALHTSLPQYKLQSSSTSPFLNLYFTNFWRFVSVSSFVADTQQDRVQEFRACKRRCKENQKQC
jgi:hypothetical protein